MMRASVRKRQKAKIVNVEYLNEKGSGFKCIKRAKVWLWSKIE